MRQELKTFGLMNFLILMMVPQDLDAIPRHQLDSKTLGQVSTRVKFPDDEDQDWKDSSEPIGKPVCAQGMTLCEDVEGYPYDLVDKVLNKSGDFAKLLADDLVEIQDSEMAGRQLEDNSLSLCNSQKKIMFPRWGVTTNKEYKFIANQNDSTQYVQAVKIEVCSAESAPCALYTELPKGYSTKCKQKYVERKLVTVSKNGEELGVDKFLIPTSCCCMYKKTLPKMRDVFLKR